MVYGTQGLRTEELRLRKGAQKEGTHRDLPALWRLQTHFEGLAQG